MSEKNKNKKNEKVKVNIIRISKCNKLDLHLIPIRVGFTIFRACIYRYCSTRLESGLLWQPPIREGSKMVPKRPGLPKTVSSITVSRMITLHLYLCQQIFHFFFPFFLFFFNDLLYLRDSFI